MSGRLRLTVVCRQKGLRSTSYAVLLSLVVYMFAQATTYWVIIVVSLLQAVEDPERYALLDVTSLGVRNKILLWCLSGNVSCRLRSELAQNDGLYQLTLSDLIVTWRSWTLWSDSPRKRWIRGVPCILLLGTIGVFSAAVILFA